MGDETAEFVTLYKKKEQKKKENNKDSHSIYVVFKLKKKTPTVYNLLYGFVFEKRFDVYHIVQYFLSRKI